MNRATATALTVLALTALAPPASATPTEARFDGPRSAEDVHCVAEAVFTLDPGISLQPSSGRLIGKEGPLDCDGVIDGRAVTGRGTWAETLRYGLRALPSCANPAGDAEGTWTATLPTADGPLTLTDSGVRYEYGPLQGGGVLGGTVDGQRHYGRFQVVPLEGDCVSAPITRVLVRCEEWIVARRGR